MFLEDIRQVCAQNAQAIACATPSKSISFMSLWRQANALARYFHETGSGPVAVVGGYGIEAVAIFLACLLCRRPYAPLDPTMPSSRLYNCLNLIKPDDIILLSQQKMFPAPALEIGVLWDKIQKDDGQDFIALRTHKQEIAYIMFTSGSTGIPKAVPITYSNLDHFISWLSLSDEIDTSGRMSIFSPAPYFFDLSVAGLYLMLARGHFLLLPENGDFLDIAPIFELLARHQCEMVICTPTYLQWLLLHTSFSEQNLPLIRQVVLCGEMLPVPVAQRLSIRFPSAHIINSYGPTEATCAVSAIRIDNADMKKQRLPIGRDCNMAVLIDIITKDGKKLPHGSWGEIVLTGPSVFSGYWKHDSEMNDNNPYPSCTSEKNCYRTGDNGCLSDGKLYIEGRIDNQFKYKGYRIEAGEIEAAVSKICKAPCVVCGVRRNGKVAWIAVCIEGEPVLSEEKIKAELKEILPEYMLPRVFCWMERFPMGKNGKCDRAKIKEWLGDEHQ